MDKNSVFLSRIVYIGNKKYIGYMKSSLFHEYLHSVFLNVSRYSVAVHINVCHFLKKVVWNM
jgi:hypothetical protein